MADGWRWAKNPIGHTTTWTLENPDGWWVAHVTQDPNGWTVWTQASTNGAGQPIATGLPTATAARKTADRLLRTGSHT